MEKENTKSFSNYRLLRRRYKKNAASKEETLYELHEVYYNSDGSLRAFRPETVISSDSVEGARIVWALMIEAFDYPVLDENDFPAEAK